MVRICNNTQLDTLRFEKLIFSKICEVKRKVHEGKYCMKIDLKGKCKDKKQRFVLNSLAS